MPGRGWLLLWSWAIHSHGNPIREPLCASPTELPLVHGELEIGRVPLRVNRSTLTTDCHGVSFGNATSRNDTDSLTCIWFPNTTVISTADVNCSTPDNDLVYILSGSSANIQVEVVQDLPSSFSTVVLDRLGIQAVGPDLTHDSAGQVVSASRIRMQFNDITSIDGVQWPIDTRILQLDYNTIEAIGDIAINNTKLTTLSLVGNRIQVLDIAMVLPPNLAHLHLDFNQISTLDNATTFPASLRHLRLTGNRLKSLPPTDVLPPALTSLGVSFNLITRLDDATSFPATLTTLDASFNKITHVVATFPSTLTTLCLAGNNITAFYANQSQFDLLSRLTNASPSASFDADHSIDDPCSLVLTATTTNATCQNHSRVELLWNTFPICIVEDDPLPRLAAPTAQPMEKEPSTNKLVWLAVGLGSAGAVALIALLIVGFRRRRRGHLPLHSWHSVPSAFDGMATWRMLQSPASLVASSPGSSVSAVSSDIRFDASMQHHLLPATTVVHRKRILASGGNGIVYLVSLTDHRSSSRLAAMKCILPSLATDTAAIANFMHEMRLTASLAHPHVVTFVGLAWTSLHDLSVMTEYMDGGDLWNVLTVTRPPQLAWHLPRSLGLEEALSSQLNGDGDANGSQRRPFSKLSVILDVAAALAYLHSLPHVVVHRDLKAKNVLLDGGWTAKLGDFGSSVVLAGHQPHADRTRMTGGTVPWTAPEVLRSDQALEAADVFSFGVLLSEVDSARIPYSHHPACVPGDDVTVEMARARVAMLVLGGTVTPQFSGDCPDSIRDMAMRCLAYHPDDRPTADQLVQWCQMLLPFQTDIY